MKRSVVPQLAVVLILLAASAAAHAQCPLPSSPGVSVCSPANGQTVTYPAQITVAATAQAGRTITAISVYANGTRIAHVSDNQLNAIDYDLKAGTYALVVNAWDNVGLLYQAKRSFTVSGGQTATCTPPAPGVLFCSPANGSSQPTDNIAASVGARGDNSPITRLQVFFDSNLMQDGATSSLTFTAGTGAAGTHTMSAKAWDKAGHVYTATTTFKTYYDGVCGPKGCTPGVFITAPAAGAAVGTTFQLRADIQNNPAPITGMKAYLDGKLVAQSFGPSIITDVSTTRGAHQLNVQGWDSKGNLYKTVQTVNVQ